MLDASAIEGGIRQIKLGAEVTLGGLDVLVAEGQLDVLEPG